MNLHQVKMHDMHDVYIYVCMFGTLSFFVPDSTNKLNVFWHYRYSFCMDGCEVAIIKQFHQVDLSHCLQCHDSLSLESVGIWGLSGSPVQSHEPVCIRKKKNKIKNKIIKKKKPYNSHRQIGWQISWNLNLCMVIVYFVKSDVLKHLRKDGYCELHLQIFSTHLWNEVSSRVIQLIFEIDKSLVVLQSLVCICKDVNWSFELQWKMIKRNAKTTCMLRSFTFWWRSWQRAYMYSWMLIIVR